MFSYEQPGAYQKTMDNIKIFILDDDETNNELEIMIMQSIGISNIDVRTSGKEALRYLDDCKEKNNFPAIMFVDLNMPGMHGFSFIKLYEENYRNFSPHTRIIMLSNSILENEKKEALKHESVLDFWSKPLKAGKLQEAIAKIKSINEEIVGWEDVKM